MGAIQVTKKMDEDPEVNMVMGMGQIVEKVKGTQLMDQAMRMKIQQTEFLLVKQ